MSERKLMSPRMRDRLAAPVVAVYWMALVAGLVVYSTARADAEDLAALWAGALGGTALGQILALRNVRGWFAAAVVGGVALVSAPMAWAGGAPLTLWQALLPAALCGYWSLGERTAAAAFWFPAMTWMLTVVDRLDGDATAAGLDARALALLGGVAVAFLALLGAAEWRRIGLWRTSGSEVVVPGRVAMLREPAGRRVARAGFGVAVAMSTLALTAWLAPHLWQAETLGGLRRTEFADGVGVGEREGVPCCPAAMVEAPRVRVREFFDVAHGVTRPPARVGVNCVACDGVDWGYAGVGRVTPTVETAVVMTHVPGDVAPLASAPAVAHVEPPPRAASPDVLPLAPSAVTPEVWSPPASMVESPRPGAPAAEPLGPSRVESSPAPQSADASLLIHVLLTLLVAAVAYATATLTLRPLRRAITLRHLRRPYWTESLEQRVSNLWQLALVALHDAGFRPRAGEQPEELARRVRVDGVEACAAVLERARHGLGLDDGDLAAMTRAAERAYRAARVRLSLLARAAACLRWPLT